MFIYKTINLINGKIYIGKQYTTNESYLGSGLLLKKAIKKYGKQNFKKEILKKCKTEDELNLTEKLFIKKYKSTNRKIGYNIAEGGSGGDTISNNPNRDLWLKKKKGKSPWNKGISMSDDFKNKVSVAKKEFFKLHPEKCINSGTFKPGTNHILYGKKRDINIVNKIVESRHKNGTYHTKKVLLALEKNREKLYKKVCYKNLKTGEEIVFNSIKELSIQLNIPRISIASLLKDTNNIKIRKKYKDITIKYYEV